MISNAATCSGGNAIVHELQKALAVATGSGYGRSSDLRGGVDQADRGRHACRDDQAFLFEALRPRRQRAAPTRGAARWIAASPSDVRRRRASSRRGWPARAAAGRRSADIPRPPGDVGGQELAEHHQVQDLGEGVLDERFDRLPAVVEAARLTVDERHRGRVGHDPFEAPEPAPNRP